MYINYLEKKEKFSNDLSIFLDSSKDGVFYIGHASILVRLNKKKYIFDVIKNTNFYNNSWLFFPSQINDKRIFDVDGVFVSHIHGDHYDPRLLKKIQDKYKSDPQKLNAEMVKLYRDNGVNPLGGCLPMLLQMPLLFSLFLVFRSTIEFRGAPFIWWIKDLSLPDTIFNLPFYIPVYGDQVAFLPLLLGISMFLTQKMSMANMDTGMGQQKYMMYFI